MKTQPLRLLNPPADGVGITAEYVNDIIERIEDLVRTAEEQRPIAGNNIQISYTANGAVINAVEE